MEKNEKRCIRLFLIWQDDKEVAWLRKMANQGWQLHSVMLFVYTFMKGEPRDTLYFLDFTISNNKDRSEYIGVFQDAGWSFICQQSNWFYFASPADNRYREVYTDNQSRLRSYRSLLLIHVFEIVMLSIIIQITGKRVQSGAFTGIDVLMIIIIILLLCFIYSIIRLIVLVSRLQKSTKE